MLVFALRPAGGVPMIDLFLDYPVPFEELWARSEVVQLRGVPVRIASIEDLILMKRRAGRPEDLAEADALSHIARLRSES